MGAIRLAGATALLAAILVAGCQSLPNLVESGGNAPQPQKAETPSPLEKLAPSQPAKVEGALASQISRTFSVRHQHALRVVRAASESAQSTGFPRSLILAVIAVESGFNPMAVSTCGARGLMQVRPEAHPQKVQSIGGPQMLHEVETGIKVGTRILWEYHKSSGNLRAALRRYSGSANRYEEKVLTRKEQFDRTEAANAGPMVLLPPSAVSMLVRAQPGGV